MFHGSFIEVDVERVHEMLTDINSKPIGNTYTNMYIEEKEKMNGIK